MTSLQDNFVFVCYDHGTGGENIALQISQLDCCYDLPARRVGHRTITQDCFRKALQKPHSDWQSTVQQAVPGTLYTEKLHVVPSHVEPCELKKYFPYSLYVVINFPSDPTSVHLSVYRKVWMNRLPTIQERIGYVKARGYTIDEEKLLKLREPLNNAEIECLFQGVDYTRSNRKRLFKKSIQNTGMQYTNAPRLLAFEYRKFDLLAVERALL